MTQKKDRLYRNSDMSVKPFRFDENVAEVFEDMINRSVPGYEQTLILLGIVSRQYVQPGSNVYDLGCSLGASTIAVLNSVTTDSYKIIAVDSSEQMLEKCREKFLKQKLNPPIDIIHADIRDIEILNASLVIINYTLQFLPVEERIPLLNKIFSGLLPGGALFVSEKIILNSEPDDKVMINLHEQFKLLNGYNELEIAQKRAALDNILVRESLEDHIDRLRDTGFSQVIEISRQLNFTTLLAIKN